MLLGKHVTPLNSNGFLALPLEYYPDFSAQPVYLTTGLDHNILLLKKSTFDALHAAIAATSITDPLARSLARWFMGNAVELKVTPEGQIQVPAELCESGSLKDEVVLVGQGEYVEIWAASGWKQHADELAEASHDAGRFERFNVSLA